jgi:hypothetical protein
LAARHDDTHRVKDALQTLDASNKWIDLENNDLGAGQIFLGDEANLEQIKTAVRADDAPKNWVIAGTGGTAISAAEIILANHPTAEITMLGRDSPAGLIENDQFRKIAENQLAREDAARLRLEGIDGVAGGRLHIVVDRAMSLGSPRVRTADDGRRRYIAWTDAEGNNYEGEGFIAALGRENQAPQLVSEMIMQARREDPDPEHRPVRYEPKYDVAGQYVGYTIEIDLRGRTHHFEVTGAVSRYIPRATVPGVNPDGSIRNSRPPPDPAGISGVQAAQLTRASSLDAHPASGNFDGGYVASAIEAWRYAMERMRRGGKL